MILAIDPGNEQSAFIEYMRSGKVNSFGKFENAEVKRRLARYIATAGDHLAIEMIASYGMPVGREVFETCVWIGRFIEAWGRPWSFVYRRDVKLHLCGSPRAKDGNVRQALLDRYGGKVAAIGTKSAPGALRGFKADIWQALAVAVTHAETVKPEPIVPKCAHPWDVGPCDACGGQG
jgi:hypothetical protein